MAFGSSVAGPLPGTSLETRVLIGAQGEGFSQEGKAYIFDLQSPASPIELVPSGNTTSPLTFGKSVSFVPDTNGDGIDARDRSLVMELLSGSPTANGRFGWSIAALYDFTGDGFESRTESANVSNFGQVVTVNLSLEEASGEGEGEGEGGPPDGGGCAAGPYPPPTLPPFLGDGLSVTLALFALLGVRRKRTLQ